MNHAATVKVRQVSGALGAELSGVDLGSDLGAAGLGEIRQALLDHCVIFFRDQVMTPDQQLAFARRFGVISIHPYGPQVPGFPEVMRVFKEKDDKVNFGGGWHSDMTFLEKPPLGSILYAKEVPPQGGDTMFANQYMAYDALSSGMKKTVDALNAVHSANAQYGVDGLSEASRHNDMRSMKPKTSEDAKAEIVHPVVRVHPETGRRALYVNVGFTQRFDGWTKDESRPLLRWLYEHCAKPEFTCRFSWTKNAVAFWDNRCTQHYALNDYHGYRREMHRVTVEGDRPR
ncbi:MAG: TauD/TfdA family dioxygenase [Micropepsaceae bacterium]